jgi:hypothetical protein
MRNPKRDQQEKYPVIAAFHSDGIAARSRFAPLAIRFEI